MIPTEQNIAIAKICTGIEWVMLECWCIRQDGRLVPKLKGPLPYTTSLDAMHEAEISLTNEQYVHFCHRLKQVNNESCRECCRCISAIALQRAKAFLYVHNAWKE